MTPLVEMRYCKQHVNEHIVDLIALCAPEQVNTAKCAVQGQDWEILPYSFQIPLLEGNMSVRVGKRGEREREKKSQRVDGYSNYSFPQAANCCLARTL